LVRRLEGKVALVTGGSRGIGRGICIAFAREGAEVVVNYHHNERCANQVVETCRSLRRRAIAVQADVSDAGQVSSMVERAVAEFGRVDILVNSAGLQVWVPALEMDLPTWQRTIDVDLTGTFLCAQAVARHMVARGGGGKIINVSSIQADRVVPPHANYAAAKGGITLLTRALAVEWAEYKINVNCIGPGAIGTDMNAEIFAHPEVVERVCRTTPWGRIGTPEDCAHVAVFLASPESEFITGQTIFVDGGRMLR
jgi:NAD(P)-dependent dehydrogenase (short-subunit alcohol dehydrogenase family)